MKKTIAILLALVMILALFACNKDSGGSSGDTPANTSQETPAAQDGGAFSEWFNAPLMVAPEDNPPTATVLNAAFDPDYDYFKNPRVKIGYLVNTGGFLYEFGYNNMKVWADKMNVEMRMIDAQGDTDLYLSSIETLKGEGYHALLLDPDVTIYEAIKDKCRDVGIVWMSSMAAAQNIETGELLAAASGFDHRDCGRWIARWLTEYKDENWPSVPLADVGFLAVDMSSSFPLHERIEGCKEVWAEYAPGLEGNFFVADTIVGGLDSTTAYQVSGAILTTQPQIKYWLIFGCMDDCADGATSAAIDAGLADVVVAATMGGPGLIQQWDAGESTPWKMALYTAAEIAVQPNLCAAYTYIFGWHTPETIWQPEWVDKSKNEKYAFYINSAMIMTEDNYQHYLKWVDLVTGLSNYDYVVPNVNVNDYTARNTTPPAYYAG